MPAELRDGVWQLDTTGVNAYLVDDGELTLVDTGMPFDTATVEAAVEAAGFDLGDLRRILLTHYDVDHVGSAAKLAVDVPIYLGSDDADLLTGDRRPLPWSLKRFTQFVAEPFTPDVPSERVRRVDDGDEVGGFRAYHAPGHTPGHTVYVHEELETAFLGDLVVERNGRLRPTPWFISEDAAEITRSIDDVVARGPAFEVAAMGHGTPLEQDGSEHLRALTDAE